MAWVILCGVDRVGKSTAAEHYRKQGYEVVHFTAPDKKYYAPGFSGPSYLDWVIELMLAKAGKDVVFDRSWYGEPLWSQVYGRKSLLDDEDIDLLREFEEQNDVTRILMHDPNVEAHWRRCVENKEPMDASQFRSARTAYYAMAKKYGFELKTMEDYVGLGELVGAVSSGRDGSTKPEARGGDGRKDEDAVLAGKPKDPSAVKPNTGLRSSDALSPEQLRLSQANAINDVLSARVVRRKGEAYDVIESKIRTFLNQELGSILGSSTPLASVASPFSKDEIQFLKTLASKVKEKR